MPHPRTGTARIDFIFLFTVAAKQQTCRISVVVVVFDRGDGIGGRTMIIDLESWEAGYADGKRGRTAACPADRDQVSYSSGHREGHAARTGTRQEVRVRYPNPSQAHLRFVR
jgi:hypothetical protein